MPVPKRKRSRARRDSRHANKFIKTTSFNLCGNCQNPLLSHAACTTCGFYKGSKILKTKVDRVVKRDLVKQKKSARSKSSTPETPEST